jgi:putative membrane protein insertion efficiency factor
MLERLTVEPRGQIGRASLSRVLSTLLVVLIRGYQWTLAPLLGACCRFEPSCSRYMLVCIERGGPFRGLWCGVRRILRCHPFSPGGYDPPPEMSS